MTDTQLKIVCDNCHKEVSPSQKQKKLKKGFFEVGLECPGCGFWVHSYYSNPELEKAQQILANFKKRSTRSHLDRWKYERKIAEFMRQHQKVQERVKSMVRV